MTKKQLQFILEQGENYKIEFKEKFDKAMSRDMVAFANVSGGRIFLGVNDKDKFEHYAREAQISSILKIQDVLVNLSVAKTVNNKLRFNNAGVLFFAKNPQRFFVDAIMDCSLFKGNDKVEILDRKIFRTGLLQQLQEAIIFCEKHLNLRYEFKKAKREEKYEIPIRAAEEAIVNSLMHRDYFFKGSHNTVYMYNDFLEISNPGGLPKGLTEKDFGKKSVRRNPIIADLFARTRYVEKIGSGIQRIKNAVKAVGLKGPKFKFGAFFEIEFIRQNGGVKKILKFIKNNPGARANLIAQNLNTSQRTIERILSLLRKDGKIEFKGATKTGGYFSTERRKTRF